MASELHHSTMEVLRLSSDKRARGTNDAPVWTLTRPLTIRGALVTGATIPNTMYTVVAGVSDTIPTSAGIATIPAGVYTLSNLAAAAQTALQAVDGTFTCTYSTLTLKYTIARPAAFSLTWTTLNRGASAALGFIPFDPAAIPGTLTSWVGDNAVSGSEPSVILLRSHELSHGSAPSFTVDAKTGSDVARIALTGSLGMGASNYEAVQSFEHLAYGSTGAVLSELSITLADGVTGLPISLNGAPWTVEVTVWVNEHKTRV